MSEQVVRHIPISSPVLGEREAAYVMDCLRTNWISSVGEYVERFEHAFAGVVGTAHAISCSNGTAALHLALLAKGVKPLDEVIVPTMTFVAPANAVMYCGATPVLADADPETWCLNVSRLEALITPRTKGIVAVHLRGHPADMVAIMEMARRHGLFVIEDAAQAHGARVGDSSVGSIGDVGTFSFFGNKMITTGEGGIVTTDDDEVASAVRLLKNQGMTKEHRYWHPVIGYNYRMTNIQAAIGLAQVDRLESQVTRHREVAGWYRTALAGTPGHGPGMPGGNSWPSSERAWMRTVTP
jgi:perosamine synthetase